MQQKRVVRSCVRKQGVAMDTNTVNNRSDIKVFLRVLSGVRLRPAAQSVGLSFMSHLEPHPTLSPTLFVSSHGPAEDFHLNFVPARSSTPVFPHPTV